MNEQEMQAIIDRQFEGSMHWKTELLNAKNALRAIVQEGKVYAVHHKLESCAQRMYDIAEAALDGSADIREPKP